MPFLPIGFYTVTVEMQGFKTYSREVPVQVGQTTRIDATLEVGPTQAKVTVTADVPLLTTETSDVGVVVNNQNFLELPLTLGGDIRNPSSFIFLSPGVAGDTWEKHIGGGSFSDAVYYDGGVLNGPSSQNDGQYNPSVDAIAEFKLISDDYSAEYGHAFYVSDIANEVLVYPRWGFDYLSKTSLYAKLAHQCSQHGAAVQ